MKIKIISWNINGIRAVVRKGFIQNLSEMQPDILGLQEVKIDDKARAAEEFDFAGYEEYWHSAKRPGYSGTLTLSRMKPLADRNGLGQDDFDDEGRLQTLEYEKFFFVNAYFPNAQPELKRIVYKEKFNQYFLRHIKKLEKKKPVIAAGDFNVAPEPIDLARPEPNLGNPGFSRQERRWAREFRQAGLVDTFRQLHPDKVQYSWWTYRAGARRSNVGWRIDHILISQVLAKRVKSAFILDQIMGSDHAPAGVEIEL